MCTAILTVSLALTAASASASPNEPATSPVPSAASEARKLDVFAPTERQGDNESARVTIDSKGFNVVSADGKTSIKIGGRIQADFTLHSPNSIDDGTEFTDGTELRRGRFELKGTLPEHLRWAAEVDFANNETSVKDFWLALDRPEGPKYTFGHQKQPFSLGVEMSSNDIPFTERGVDNFLIIPFIDRAIGLRVEDNSEKTFYAAGIFGEGVSPSPLEDEGYGAVGRVVHAPVQEEDKVLHLAARAAYRMPSGADEIRIRDETTNMSDYRVVDTGVITDVDDVTLWGAEAAYAFGPTSISGEYNQLAVGREGEDFDFSSWHVETTYTLTGESRADAYRIGAGEFKRLKSQSDNGAWELAARYATLDLNDGSLSGGSEDVITVALNWYASPNLRLMLDWSHILDTSGGSNLTSEADGVDIIAFRAQLTF